MASLTGYPLIFCGKLSSEKFQIPPIPDSLESPHRGFCGESVMSFDSEIPLWGQTLLLRIGSSRLAAWSAGSTHPLKTHGTLDFNPDDSCMQTARDALRASCSRTRRAQQQKPSKQACTSANITSEHVWQQRRRSRSAAARQLSCIQLDASTTPLQKTTQNSCCEAWRAAPFR